MSETELLSKILQALETKNVPSLWGIKDVMAYFGMSQRTVEEKIISCADFPRPFRVNGTNRRWRPEEVQKWEARKRA